MRIIWFTENYPPNKGGMSRSCDRIVAHLRAHYTVDVFHFTNKFPAFKTEHQEKGTYTSVPVYEDSAHTLNTLWAFIQTHPLIEQSAVFTAFGSHLCLKGITLMANWLQKPVLICFRGNDFDNAIFSQKKQDLLYSISHATAIACVSSEKQVRIKRMQLNSQVYFTPNSIDFEPWKVLKADRALANQLKSELKLAETTKIIGLVGFLKQKKGVDFFMRTLKKSQLLKHVHLHFVGEIEPHIELQLMQSDWSYSQVQPISKTELIAHYLVCDAVAIPSIYDGMPNVIFEAAALDIPIIASKAGGIPDILDKVNAFLFDVLSERALLNALADFDDADKVALEKKSARLKQHIKSAFTTDQEIKNYIDIFNTITTIPYEN